MLNVLDSFFIARPLSIDYDQTNYLDHEASVMPCMRL